MKKRLKNQYGILLIMVGLGIAVAAPSFAENIKDKGKAEADAPAPMTQDIEALKKQTINYLHEIGNQEVRVITLAQLYTQESNILRQKQALFCDLYKLDIEKWRKGLYQYDNNTGKFNEKEIAATRK